VETRMHYLAGITLVLISILACDIPSTSTYMSIPTLDPAGLSTLVAGTAAAMETQTMQAGSPENGPSSAPTATTAPLATAISPTPKVYISAYGTSINQLADGTALFIDQQGKYEIIVPAGWTAFRINEPEYFKLWTLPIASDPGVQSSLTFVQGMDPNLFRLFAFDLRPDHFINGFTSNINVLTQNNSVLHGMSLQTLLETNTKSIPQSLKGMKVISSKVSTTGSNMPIGVIETNLSTTTSTGNKLSVFEQVVIFMLPQVTLTITLATPISIQANLLPEFKAIIDSVKILGQ
jgi:hypothetical protein